MAAFVYLDSEKDDSIVIYKKCRNSIKLSNRRFSVEVGYLIFGTANAEAREKGLSGYSMRISLKNVQYSYLMHQTKPRNAVLGAKRQTKNEVSVVKNGCFSVD